MSSKLGNQIKNISKNNTNTRNTLYLENSRNSSNALTSSQFYLIKNLKTVKNSDKKKISEEKNTKIENEINIKENKIIRNIDNYINDENLVIHNKMLNNKNIKPLLNKVKNEYEIYQDYTLDEYKNVNNKDPRNAIEKLSACIEKKYNTIKPFKIRNYENKLINIKGASSIDELGKEYISFSSKKMKHSYSTSHILDKRNQNEYPILINNPLSYEKKFSSHSEKERNDKNMSALIKLKHFLNLYWKKRKEIVEEFFQKNNIYGDLFYREKNLYNFANYINDNIYDDISGTKVNIETRFPMIEIILKGIKYKPTFTLKKKDESQIKKSKLKLKIKQIETGEDLDKEKEIQNYIDIKSKVEKYRAFINRNYKKSVIDKLLKRLTKKEKLIYFSGKKYGEVEIADKQNLANNIHKQALYQKIYNSLSSEKKTKKSINSFNNEDLKKLNEELKIANDSVFKKSMNENKIREREKLLGIKGEKLNENIIDKLNERLYYTIKVKYHKNHPEVIPKKKQKLLEYIIANKVKQRKDFLDKLLQNKSNPI